jgi:DNA-binding NtrC family response regulator
VSELASNEVASSPDPRTARSGSDAIVRALVVHDEEALRNTLARVLKHGGIGTVTAENGFVALDLLERERFDVVLVDVRMPGMTGPQFLERVKAARHSVEVVMMTAFADIATTASAVKAGAYAFLTKPFVSNESVVIEVLNAAQYKRLRERTEHLQRELRGRPPATEMVGACAAMRDTYRLVEGVATTSSTILVLGESGTGKELVARAIHERSTRAGKPFITVDCAAIPKDLVESELFGHTRGAFTSASSARAGLFEAAHGGTIFLDDIADLPASAQVKLLRTLQSGEVKPVGSDTVETVDVRVVAATNADLKSAIAAGTFRQDLFYRLNVVQIRLPPLRERGDDVLLLAHHFLQKHAAIAGRRAARLASDAAMALERYDWPGNVRELEHAIEHAVVLSDSETITARFLPLEVQRAAASRASSPDLALPIAPPAPVTHGAPTSMPALVLAARLAEAPYAEAKKRVLAEFNEAYVASLLQASGGNMSEAARRSGLDRSNFRRLVRSTSVDAASVRKRDGATDDGDGDGDA